MLRIFSTVRKFAKWSVIPAFISLVIAHEFIINNYPGAIGYSLAPPPPYWILLWRNTSLFFAVLAGLIALPSWQSFLGLTAIVIFLSFALRF